MKILVLEDNEERIAQFKKRLDRFGGYVFFCRTAKECIEILKENADLQLVLLDHDLGGEVYVDTAHKNTGSEVARWMRDNYDMENTQIIIHSLNTVGAEYMRSQIPEAHVVPFVWTKEVFDKTVREK